MIKEGCAVVMNRRQKKLILLLLNETDYRGVRYYANKLGCSERTTYNDLQKIDQLLKPMGFKLDRKPGVGTKLMINHQDRLIILSKVNIQSEPFGQYSTEERQTRIALRLLYENCPIPMQRFADEYYVSKTSIAKDIDKLEQKLLHFNLTLIRDRQGILINGLERNRRRAIAAFLEDILNDQQNCSPLQSIQRLDVATIQRLSDFFSGEVVDGALKIINNIEQKNKLHIDTLYYLNIITHLLILIKRVEQGQHAEFSYSEKKNIEPMVENITQQLKMNVHEVFSKDISQAEAQYVAHYIFYCSERGKGSKQYEIVPDQSIFDHTINAMVDAFSKVMDVDLRNDAALKNGLKLHMGPMVERLKMGLNLTNPMLIAIKSRYQSIFFLTWLISIYLENQFHVRLNDDEVGFLTLHFLAAIERRIHENSKQVVIICYGGIGTSQYLANRLKSRIPEIKVLDVIPLAQLEKVNLNEIDFIITTVPIRFDQKPVIMVSPILDEHDIIKINQYIFGLKNKYYQRPTNYNKVSPTLMKLFNPELIFTQKDMHYKQDILHFVCDELYAKGFVKQSYKTSVFAREARSPTSVGNGVAIPHGSETYILKPQIVFFTSKNAVDWGNEDVSLIFLIAVKTSGTVDFRLVLKELYRIFDNEGLIRTLKKSQDPKEVYQLICQSSI